MSTPWLRRGISLVEVLIAITIFAGAVTSVLGAFGVLAKASDLSRRKATMAILAESASETVAYDTYANCASTGSYSLAAVTKPAGFNVVVSSVQYWNKSSSPVGWVNTCTVDPGAQQITITASSTGASYTTVLVVAKEAP